MKRVIVTLGSNPPVEVDVDERPTKELTVRVAGREVTVEVLHAAGNRTLALIDQRVVDLWVQGEPRDLDLTALGRRTRASAALRGIAGAAGGSQPHGGNSALVSPMAGRVIKVLVHEGQAVAPRTPVVIVEAMKMENELRSECGGVVRKVLVAEGQTVGRGAKLVEVA